MRGTCNSSLICIVLLRYTESTHMTMPTTCSSCSLTSYINIIMTQSQHSISTTDGVHVTQTSALCHGTLQHEQGNCPTHAHSRLEKGSHQTGTNTQNKVTAQVKMIQQRKHSIFKCTRSCHVVDDLDSVLPPSLYCAITRHFFGSDSMSPLPQTVLRCSKDQQILGRDPGRTYHRKASRGGCCRKVCTCYRFRHLGLACLNGILSLHLSCHQDSYIEVHESSGRPAQRWVILTHSPRRAHHDLATVLLKCKDDTVEQHAHNSWVRFKAEHCMPTGTIP